MQQFILVSIVRLRSIPLFILTVFTKKNPLPGGPDNGSEGFGSSYVVIIRPGLLRLPSKRSSNAPRSPDAALILMKTLYEKSDIVTKPDSLKR